MLIGALLSERLTEYCRAPARFIELAQDLSPGEHILACEVSKETTSGGYKWRVQGIASL